MKKMNIAGIIAAMTITASTMAVPALAKGQITETQAKQIALKHAGIAKEDASFANVKTDLDDGVQQFDVKFYVGMTEYNYDIDASTGRIIEFDAEIDD